jgi:hypothetical protein
MWPATHSYVIGTRSCVKGKSYKLSLYGPPEQGVGFRYANPSGVRTGVVIVEYSQDYHQRIGPL